MGPIALLRSLWTFSHIRRMGSPGGCDYCIPLSLPPTAAATATATATDAAATTAAAATAAAAAAAIWQSSLTNTLH